MEGRELKERLIRYLLLLACACLPAAAGVRTASAAGTAEVVRGGRIACTLLLSDELLPVPDGSAAIFAREQGRGGRLYADIAVAELQRHLRLAGSGEVALVKTPAAGAEAAVRRLRNEGATVILLGGRLALGGMTGSILEKGSDPEAFMLQIEEGVVRVAGLSPKGILNGAYELLEQVGFRWFLPGELGLVVPQSKNLSLREQKRVFMPSFPMRQLSGSALTNFTDWTLRMRNSAWSVPGGHGMPPFDSSARRNKLFAAHPEYFALINGERQCRQLCVSNPEVLHLVVEAVRNYFRSDPTAEYIGLGSQDGGGWCECAGCRALDGGNMSPLSNTLSVTDRYIWFYNQVLRQIEDEFPDKKIGTLIYNNFIEPPVRVKPNPRIVGRMALIHLCRIHSPLNSACPEGSYYNFIEEGWRRSGIRLFNSGYWFNLADPGLPFITLHRIRDEVPLAYRLGHLGFSRGTAAHWASETPSLYVAAKLMWNHEADVDELLNDFHEKFYGPAAVPMAAYTALMDASLRDADFHTGRSWDMPFIYPAASRQKARLLLKQAAVKAGTGIYGRRVQLARQSLDYLDAFVDMLEERNHCDFTAAYASLQRLYAVQKELLEGYDIPMLRAVPAAVGARRFLDMYYARVTLEGFKRVSESGELAAGLSDSWEFLMDPPGIGEKIGLQRPETRGGNWQRIRTSLSWGDQGLRYYFGEAWYRQRVSIPARFAGRRLMIWFSGVDDSARVWVNGRLLGDSPGAVFDLGAHAGSSAPFEFDATAAVRPGAENLITVRVRRNKSNELGTGGIMGPVMFYAPKP